MENVTVGAVIVIDSCVLLISINCRHQCRCVQRYSPRYLDVGSAKVAISNSGVTRTGAKVLRRSGVKGKRARAVATGRPEPHLIKDSNSRSSAPVDVHSEVRPS